jgi:hypothetical protein
MTADRDIPVAVPVGWSNSEQGRRPVPMSRQTTATTPMRYTHPVSARVGSRGLAAVRRSLSARDIEVVERAAAHRYLTTRQIEGFCFADHATPLTAARVCRRVLRRLCDLRVLVHLKRRVGGVRAGSASFVWQVGPVGDRLMRKSSTGHVRRRTREPSVLFLDHCLAVADAHLALLRAHRAPRLELVEVQTEPDCWRPFSGYGGGRQILKPDLYLVTADPGDTEFVNCWFIEVDRGTENPARLLAKCEVYEAYRRTGTEQADDGAFPLVVWVMANQGDVDRLRTRLQADRSLDQRMYRITTAARLAELVARGVA